MLLISLQTFLPPMKNLHRIQQLEVVEKAAWRHKAKSFLGIVRGTKKYIKKETSLLWRLRTASLNVTPPIGKIHPFSKMAVTFNPMIAIFYVF